MFLIKDKNFLKKKHKDHINNIILGPNFPWYFKKTSVTSNKFQKIKKLNSYLMHMVVERIETREQGVFSNSSETNFCIDILNLFCKKHNIKYKNIFRAAFNLTFNNGNQKSGVHIDHNFYHKQLIVYLNECNEKSFTIIKNNKKEIKIKPEQFKGICFESKPHYHIFPKKEPRFVLVITFN